MSKIPIKAKRAIAKRKIELREKLWPGVKQEHIWERSRDGFGSVPRALPLMITIMNHLSDTGKPVGGAYLEIFCRLRDEGFISLNQQEDMALASGFTGQRYLHTFRDRLSKLEEMKFISLKEGAINRFGYALIWNPYHAIRRHHESGKVSDRFWNALVFRAAEIGAPDLEEELPKLPCPNSGSNN
jgi:hypothetical protein